MSYRFTEEHLLTAIEQVVNNATASTRIVNARGSRLTRKTWDDSE